MSLDWYTVLPNEIWREIGMVQWTTYKVALRINKTLNLMLRDVDIKARFATYCDSLSNIHIIPYCGWLLPDSKWLIYYKLTNSWSVDIWKKGQLVKQYIYEKASTWDRQEEFGSTNANVSRYWKITDISRYLRIDNSMYRELIHLQDGVVAVYTREKYVSGNVVEYDTYLSGTSTIQHYSALDGTRPTTDVAKSGFKWYVNYKTWFLFCGG
jgi:hypothetical protein